MPFLPSTTLLFDGVTFTVPKRGEKLDLLEFSRKSARIYRAEQLKNLEIRNPERHTERLMNALQKELRLDRPPRHIECFDNSNLQGSHPVASCVVFRDGKPSRKEYRHFNIKTVEGPDDYASMREVVYRRYSRLQVEGGEMPDLIIADGGKGQMGVIHEVLEALQLDIPIAGLAKDDRHRTAELYCGYPPLLVGLRPTSPLFSLSDEYPGRGAPLRHHVPPPEAEQGLYPQRTGADRRGGGEDHRDAAAPLPHGGEGPCGQSRGVVGTDRSGAGPACAGLFREREVIPDVGLSAAFHRQRLWKTGLRENNWRKILGSEEFFLSLSTRFAARSGNQPGWRNR